MVGSCCWALTSKTKTYMTFLKRKEALPQTAKIRYKEGVLEIARHGTWYSMFRDPYYLLLTVPWAGFVMICAIGYITLNIIFALLFMYGGSCIANLEADNFLGNFFFSVQTLGSIGYGFMYPTTLYSNVAVTTEAFVGLLSTALVTGITFARVSKPTTRVLFSKSILISKFESKPSVMFRSANFRRNNIVEAQVTLYVMIDLITAEGAEMRRIFELPILRPKTPNFSLSWTVVHQITEESPLFGETETSLANKRAMFFVSMVGIDDVLSQTVYARKNYGINDVIWDGKFADVVVFDPAGHRTMDYSNFHVVEKV
jgi:inward rectifier potassium channel